MYIMKIKDSKTQKDSTLLFVRAKEKRMRRFTAITLFVALVCTLIFVTSVVMSIKFRPLKKQVIYPAPPPTPAPTVLITTSTTTTTTTFLTTTTTPAPTTPPPTFAPLTIVCPPDINITLGSSLELSATGYPVASGGDTVNCGEPVAFYSDEPAGIVARSPSYSDSNIVPGSFDLLSITGTNESYVSSTLNSNNLEILTSTESVYEFFPPGTTPFTLSGTQGSVYWDGSASRYIILENSNPPGSHLFLHLNNSLGWDTIVLNITGENPQLGVWKRAYVITVAAASNNMCVVDRLAILGGDLSPDNFCDTSILGPLVGFSMDRQSWTPMGSIYVDNVLDEIESAGTYTIGAIFMRHHDDELHDGASTPLYDWIDVEQWTSINFTTHDFISLRYTISIDDFRSNPTTVTTPEGINPLDARLENIMPRLIFQTQHNKTLVAFTSSSLSEPSVYVRWAELKWQTPTLLLAARFILSQQNRTAENDGFNRWLPTAQVDAYGTVVVGYNLCDNSTVWPSLYAASRLNNDPTNGLRQEVLVYEGTGPSVVPATGEWGPWASMSSSVPREFLYSGQVSQGLHVARRLRITGNIIERTFTGANICNQTTCIQTIIES